MPQSHTIGLLSDTHSQSLTPKLLEKLKHHFEGCTHILHAGDITHPLVLEELEAYGWKVTAVRGNMDFHPGLSFLPSCRLVTIEDLQVGLCHGGGCPSTIKERVLNEFSPNPPPIIVYGHTHKADDSMYGGVRFLNPGSPTDKRWAKNHTVGLLTVCSDDIQFQILPV